MKIIEYNIKYKGLPSIILIQKLTRLIKYNIYQV